MAKGTMTGQGPRPPEDAAGLVRACRALYAAIEAFDAQIAERLGLARNDLRCLNALEQGPNEANAAARHLSTVADVYASVAQAMRGGEVRGE